MDRGEYVSAMTYRLIDEEPALAEVSHRLRSARAIALDCEAAGFHRYTDRLCLVQLSTEEETLLFDPLGLDLRPVLRPVLEDPGVEVVMHGADYDIRLLHRDLDTRLRGLFDTQAAASLLGATSLGLASLLETHLGVKLSKAHQRADWAQRPLPEELLDYAAADTEHLLRLRDVLLEELRERGRDDWAREEFRALEETRWEEDGDADPVTRIKAARSMDPRGVTALRAALAWRDGIARERDRAPFRVAGDAALLSVVAERPSSPEALGAIKGISPRLARESGPSLIRRLREVEQLPDDSLQGYPRWQRNGPGRPTPEEEATAARLRELRAMRAKELGLEKGVVLSNAKIVEIVRAAPRSMEALASIPGLRSWQIRLLGREILQLLN